MKNLKFYLSAILIGGALISCEKVDELQDQAQDSGFSADTQYPEIEGTNGLLAAINTVTTVESAPGFPVEVTLGTGVAIFYDSLSTSTFVDAGTVRVEDKTLEKQENGTYAFIPSATDFSGVDYSGSATWDVSGSANVAAFNETYSTFPSTPDFDGDYSTIEAGAELNINLETSVSNADSIIVMLATENGQVLKTYAGNVSSFTFTQAEVESVGTGQGLVQVTPYSFEVRAVNNKSFAFVNETSVSEFTEVK